MNVSYDQIKLIIDPPPPELLVDIYNRIHSRISDHPSCVNDDDPFEKLTKIGKFCVSATSIQSKYIALVLGKHNETAFPEEVIQLFFNIESDFKMQFAKIKGKQYDGCIACIHQEEGFYDLQKVYDYIYYSNL